VRAMRAVPVDGGSGVAHAMNKSAVAEMRRHT
jgi:hypothetical protein